MELKSKWGKRLIWTVATMAVLMIGVVGAVIVDYLSNTTVASVEVSSPFLLQQAADGTWDTTVLPVVIPAAKGGSTATVNFRAINNGNNAISAVFDMVIENSEGIGCSDFTSVVIPQYEGSLTCSVINATAVEYKTSAHTFAVGSNDGVGSLTFNIGAIGDYTISSKIIVG